jgi:queuine tRNA-ribosyltransferase
VGAGTFLPVKTDVVSEHKMHAEFGEVPAAVADALNAVRAAGGRIVCVGTTSLRLLESATGEDGVIKPFADETAIFITPGYRFRAADVLMTNFHLPKSTLFMLVSAFAGQATMKAAYEHAIATGYRFYSYGDGACCSAPKTEHRLMVAFPFEISATDGAARTGVLKTPRGDIRTPAFMPVGTAATVKAMTVDQVKDTGADIILGNTYHLMLRPTAERVKRLGGLHKFMRWDKPILTDSGGFQVMSLSGISKVTEEAVTFSSHIDGSKHVLSPERSMEIQADLLGSDIVMQLDECVAWPAEEARARQGMELSARWGCAPRTPSGRATARRCSASSRARPSRTCARSRPSACRRSASTATPWAGSPSGEGHEAMCEVLDYAPAMLPADRPRYLMGVGKPIDLVEAVYRGVDMFDCVLPTRSGRHGQAWTWDGAINIKNARYADDEDPLDPTSTCSASRDYSKAYLRHLFKAEEILGQVLLSWHNIAFFQALTAAMRSAIAEGRFEQFRTVVDHDLSPGASARGGR